MRDVADLIFGVSGQSVTFDCPEGRPSAVSSVKVFRWDSEDDFEELTGSGTVEASPSTTTDAEAAAGQRTIPVTATTGMEVGRSYLLTSADGAREWFEVAEVASGVSVTAKHLLHNTFASGSTVQTTRITAALDDTWLADEDNLDDSSGPNPAYRVRWVYTVAGITFVADSYFSLVRYAGKHGVKPQDMESLSPNWLDRLPTDHFRDQGRRLIDEAYRGVKIDLHQIWTDDAMVANAEIMDELVRYKALEQGEFARLMTGSGSRDAYETARLAYHSRFDQLAKITSKVPIRTADGGAMHVAALPLTRR
jgi:hypothetical protein